MAELIPEHSDRCLSALQQQNLRCTDPGRDYYSQYIYAMVFSVLLLQMIQRHVWTTCCLSNFRTMIFRDIERQIHPQRVINKVVFDLDYLLKQEPVVAENCLLSVAKEELKLGHTRKPSNSRYIQLEICLNKTSWCRLFSLFIVAKSTVCKRDNEITHLHSFWFIFNSSCNLHYKTKAVLSCPIFKARATTECPRQGN